MVFVWLLILTHSVFAQTGEDIRNHVIIVIDERVANWKPGDTDIRDKVMDYLFNPITINGQTLYEGEPLYKEGDFLSIITFSLAASDTTTEDFTGIANYDGLQYKFIPYSEQVKSILQNHWGNIAKKRPFPEKRHSIFSIAIPHAMKRCIRENDYQLTNRTFVLMITDRSYSDKDYFDDIRDFTDSQWSYYGSNIISKYDLLGISQSVSKDYFINWINQDEKRYQFWTSYHLRTKNVDLYELQPLQEHLTMSAVVRFPERIIAKRGRWGKYTVNLSITPENSTRFNVLKLTASLQGKDVSDQNLQYVSESPEIPFENVSKTFYLGKRRNNDACIQLRVWANLKDGFYNATVLSPSEVGNASMGKNGLNVIIPIDYEERAKTVFGLLPLWSVFCFTENQAIAATLINIFIIVSFIISLFIFIIKTRYYEPSIDEIEIKFKNRENRDTK